MHRFLCITVPSVIRQRALRGACFGEEYRGPALLLIISLATQKTVALFRSLVRLRVRLEHLSDGALVARIVIVSLGWILDNPKPAGGVLNRVVLNFDARKVGSCPGEQVAWIIKCGDARKPTSV